MKRLDNKKAFTLIELLVTIAVLGVLVLLASPRFLGHTQKAELTKGFANAKTIEKASELYYMDNYDWPRLTDEPYTSEEVESYSERIFDKTGQEVNLDPDGNYYDIDYDKLSDYVQVPDDKKNYILQNPVGKVYYMENLTEVGVSRVNYSNVKEDDSPIGPREPVEGEIAIDSAEDLAKIGKSGESEYPLDGEYILTSDIDLSGTNWTPIGSFISNTNKKPFTGSFDGNGYSIARLTINMSTTYYVGLFGYTEGATIENVALEGVNVRGKESVGGLVGWARNSTEISNSYVTGSVSGSSRHVGGLVGDASSSTISNSYVTGSVSGGSHSVGGLVGYVGSSIISNSYSTGSVTGGETNVGGLVGKAYGSTKISRSYATGSVKGTKHNVGGFVGWAEDSSIENSYATGSVTGLDSNVGGLLGGAGNNTTIENSYSTGKVTGTTNVGGLVGVDYGSNVTISNSYWNRQTTGQSSSPGGAEGKTTSDMKLKTTYSGWNFTNIWEITPGNYPTLR